MCSLEIEFLSYFFVQRHYFTNIRSTLFSKLRSVDANIAKFSDEIVKLLFYESYKFGPDQNHKILSSYGFILKSERF